MTPRPNQTTIRHQGDLLQFWTDMVGPGEFGRRSLWFAFLDETGRTHPLLVPIDDVPDEPADLLVANLARMVAGLVAKGQVASVVMLLVRPGGELMTASDRQWAVALRTAIGRQSCDWPVHLATRDGVQVFAPDDLITAA